MSETSTLLSLSLVMSELLARLCATENLGEQPSVALLAAHPDDEVIGAGGLLSRLRRVTLIHATDGAPRAMGDARRAGFTTRGSYASARRGELCRALQLAGIAPARTRRFRFTDQEASLDLANLTRRLTDTLGRLRPEILLTHAYEGGHPDHDAAAFSAQAACRLLEKNKARAPARIEFTSYHECEGEMRRGRFLVREDSPESLIVLTPEERELKRSMFDCFVSQAVVLCDFAVESERFRVAPRYDFAAPPHPGRLNYERHGWGWTGERWRALARRALVELGLRDAW